MSQVSNSIPVPSSSSKSVSAGIFAQALSRQTVLVAAPSSAAAATKQAAVAACVAAAQTTAPVPAAAAAATLPASDLSLLFDYGPPNYVITINREFVNEHQLVDNTIIQFGVMVDQVRLPEYSCDIVLKRRECRPTLFVRLDRDVLRVFEAAGLRRAPWKMDNHGTLLLMMVTPASAPSIDSASEPPPHRTAIATPVSYAFEKGLTLGRGHLLGASNKRGSSPHTFDDSDLQSQDSHSRDDSLSLVPRGVLFKRSSPAASQRPREARSLVSTGAAASPTESRGASPAASVGLPKARILPLTPALRGVLTAVDLAFGFSDLPPPSRLQSLSANQPSGGGWPHFGAVEHQGPGKLEPTTGTVDDAVARPDLQAQVPTASCGSNRSSGLPRAPFLQTSRGISAVQRKAVADGLRELADSAAQAKRTLPCAVNTHAPHRPTQSLVDSEKSVCSWPPMVAPEPGDVLFVQTRRLIAAYSRLFTVLHSSQETRDKARLVFPNLEPAQINSFCTYTFPSLEELYLTRDKEEMENLVNRLLNGDVG